MCKIEYCTDTCTDITEINDGLLKFKLGVQSESDAMRLDYYLKKDPMPEAARHDPCYKIRLEFYKKNLSDTNMLFRGITDKETAVTSFCASILKYPKECLESKHLSIIHMYLSYHPEAFKLNEEKLQKIDDSFAIKYYSDHPEDPDWKKSTNINVLCNALLNKVEEAITLNTCQKELVLNHSEYFYGNRNYARVLILDENSSIRKLAAENVRFTYEDRNSENIFLRERVQKHIMSFPFYKRWYRVALIKLKINIKCL